jgi:hypothetical protein
MANSEHDEYEEKVKKLLRSPSYKILKHISIFKEEYDEKIISMLDHASINYEIKKDHTNAIRILNKIINYIDNDNDQNKGEYYFRIAKNYFKLKNNDETKKYCKIAYDEYIQKHKFSNAEKVLLMMKDIIYDVDEMIDLYNLLISLFEIQEKQGLIEKYKLEMADYYIKKDDLQTAMNIYEYVAESYLNNPNKKYHTAKIILKSGFCRIAIGDTIAINNGVYKSIYLDNKTELRLLKDICDIIENNCIVDDFNYIIRKYDDITKFDEYEIALLLKIKKIIETTN